MIIYIYKQIVGHTQASKTCNVLQREANAARNAGRFPSTFWNLPKEDPDIRGGSLVAEMAGCGT